MKSPQSPGRGKVFLALAAPLSVAALATAVAAASPETPSAGAASGGSPSAAYTHAPPRASASAYASAPASVAASAPVPVSASASASASVSASAAPAPDAVPAIPIADWIPPEEASPQPKGDEWQKATPLELARYHSRCSVAALREWVQIACRDVDGQTMGVRPLGGSDENVSMTDFNKPAPDVLPTGVNIVLPVRRGDRRVLSLNRWESGGWKSFFIVEDTDVVISELWLPGDKSPSITIH